ncbi:MAG: NAD(P)H-dependent oxidoreductase [Thermoguttaceae bacterium]|jgi:NAD(P)H-dependent FMN reductase|nr:NAD(P)H-dependent oxidoreductase [Thermoguttaceae bacterium]
MKISIIAGSHRHESESARVARYVEAILRKIGVRQTYLLSLSDNPLPLWDEGVWQETPRWKELWSPIAAELRESDGLVIVSPEWSGMVPAGLKNFFLLCGGDVLAHKPGLIVAVSASLGGAYPVAELRMSSYKNTRICYIPDHVIVRNVGQMLRGNEPADEHDASLRQRIEYSLRVLLQYAEALRRVRSSGVVDLKSFPYGM